jgi:hypothetical protein
MCRMPFLSVQPARASDSGSSPPSKCTPFCSIASRITLAALVAATRRVVSLPMTDGSSIPHSWSARSCLPIFIGSASVGSAIPRSSLYSGSNIAAPEYIQFVSRSLGFPDLLNKVLSLSSAALSVKAIGLAFQLDFSTNRLNIACTLFDRPCNCRCRRKPRTILNPRYPSAKVLSARIARPGARLCMILTHE